MKRGIVMEVKRRKAVVLTENGRFETIRLPKGTSPGVGEKVAVPDQETDFAGHRKSNRWFPVMSTVAAILIFVVLLGGLYTSNPDETIAAYVSYDVNPSFSAAVNGHMQVVSVQTWNQDATKLFSEWHSYRFMKLKSFSRIVVEKIAQSGYLNEDPHILIATTVVTRDQDERTRVAASLRNVIDSIRSGELLTKRSVAVTVKTADPGIRKKANAHGLSLGKYLLYLSAYDRNKNLSIHMAKQLSVAELEHKMQDEEPELEPNTGEVTDLADGPKTAAERKDNGKHLGLMKRKEDLPHKKEDNGNPKGRKKEKSAEKHHDNGKHKGWEKQKPDGEHHDNGKHKGWEKQKPDGEHHDNGKHKGWAKAKADHGKHSDRTDKEKKNQNEKNHSPADGEQSETKHDGEGDHGNSHPGKKNKHHDNGNHGESRNDHKGPQSKSTEKIEKELESDHEEIELNIGLPDFGLRKGFLKPGHGLLHIVIKFDKKTE